MAKNETAIQAIKFALFSASAGIIQAITFTLMNETLTLSYWPSYLTALVLSVLWNFTFNRKFTFKSATNIPLAMLKVAAFYAVFTPLSTTIGNYFAETKGVNDYIVLGVTMAFNLTLEFVYDKFFVFKDSNDKKEVSDTELENEAAVKTATVTTTETVSTTVTATVVSTETPDKTEDETA